MTIAILTLLTILLAVGRTCAVTQNSTTSSLGMGCGFEFCSEEWEEWRVCRARGAKTGVRPNCGVEMEMLVSLWSAWIEVDGGGIGLLLH